MGIAACDGGKEGWGVEIQVVAYVAAQASLHAQRMQLELLWGVGVSVLRLQRLGTTHSMQTCACNMLHHTDNTQGITNKVQRHSHAQSQGLFLSSLLSSHMYAGPYQKHP